MSVPTLAGGLLATLWRAALRPPPTSGWRRLVYRVMALYGVASIALMATHKVGLTSEHVILVAIIAAVLIERSHSFVWEWLPFLFVGVIYEDLHGVASLLGVAVHANGPAVFERSLLGGHNATPWLQSYLAPNGVINWYTVPFVVEYLAHFAAPFLAGLWLWIRHRDRFGTFVNAYFILMTLGFMVYIVYPEMPPWLASQAGLVPGVHRLVVVTLLQMGSFGQVYAGANPYPNGAMPSLHVALPMVIACTVIAVSGQRRPLAWLWLLYPLTIAFGVVYLGEHYVADAVIGLAFGLVSFLIAEHIHWHAAHRSGVLFAHPGHRLSLETALGSAAKAIEREVQLVEAWVLKAAVSAESDVDIRQEPVT